MNIKIIVGLLIGGMSTSTLAADTSPQPQTNQPATIQSSATNPAPATPATTNTSTTPATTNTSTTPSTTQTQTTTTSPVTTITCEYKIAPEKTDIKPELIKTWAQYATKKSFDMNAGQLDQQMEELKNCYTKQGWEGFQSALDKSGNLKAIKQEKLSVNSQIDGSVALSQVKANQWKATMPVTVMYQNDKQKLTQLLSVDVMIGRKISGDLGIMQMIATPRVAGDSQQTSGTSSSGSAAASDATSTNTTSSDTMPTGASASGASSSGATSSGASSSGDSSTSTQPSNNQNTAPSTTTN